MKIVDFVLGHPIATDRDEVERVGPFVGVGVLGLDALGSAAYGPEALLTALLPLGHAASSYLAPLTTVIVAILVLLALSYFQTIKAYPNGGGAYTVAKENLGERGALIAAAALCLDYVLNVAVAISSGVGALASVFPALLPHALAIGLGLLAFLTLVNLRGVRSTGAVVLLPTYAFVACLLAVLGIGLFSSHPPAPAPLSASVASASAPSPPAGLALTWLLAKAFSSGCTAMTGVEAVSNGVPIFERPSVRGARVTLALISGLLIALLTGIALLATRLGIVATVPGRAGYESVLSQLTRAVMGRGLMYDVTMASIMAVLALSANTSFADFPRVCRLLARDEYLPEPFVHRGRRLAFSHGIWLLAGLSAALLVLFDGVADHLIPLFALGALSAFSMSQVGMVAHWRKHAGGRARLALGLNLLGALATGLTLCVVLVSKLRHGAWLSVLLVGVLLLAFRAIRRHYDFMTRATATSAALAPEQFEAPVALVPVRRWDAVSVKALLTALGISREVYVVQVLLGDRDVDDLTPRWNSLVVEPAAARGLPAPQLVLERSEFRNLFDPVLQAVQRIASEHPKQPVFVVVSELVEPRWYQRLLHGQTAVLLRRKLRALGNPRIVIVSTPWSLRDWLPERRWLRAAFQRSRRRRRRQGAAALEVRSERARETQPSGPTQPSPAARAETEPLPTSARKREV